MDKRTTKQDFIKEIRQHLKALGVRKGERLEINETVSRQRVTMGEKVYNNEIRVKSVTSSGVFLEWYTNGERRDYSGEYPYNNVNVDYMTAFNISRILAKRTEAAS